MSKQPNWPTMRIRMGITPEGDPWSIVIRPWGENGAVYREVQTAGVGSVRLERIDPKDQLPWLSLYYMQVDAEIGHETNELIRSMLRSVTAAAEALSRLAFWRRRRSDG